jgi:hypothetical protein
VIGGSQPSENMVEPLAGGRKHLSELIMYEIHISDFVLDFNTQGKAPIEAFIDKLEYTCCRKSQALFQDRFELGPYFFQVD